jgi:hypothetical protein
MEAIRETLFGDMPLRRWAVADEESPWDLFVRAADRVDGSDDAGARDALREVLAQKDLESRHYLQAWNALRELGEQPSDDVAKHLYGVVIDMPVADGWDTLAAYEDGRCRYLNYSGSALIWETRDAEIDNLREQLLTVGGLIVAKIGPWTDPRPPMAAGQVRLSFLCPSGLHFGQGPISAITSDPAAGAFLSAGAALLQALVAKTGR